jgi:hypothetical protein
MAAVVVHAVCMCTMFLVNERMCSAHAKATCCLDKLVTFHLLQVWTADALLGGVGVAAPALQRQALWRMRF